MSKMRSDCVFSKLTPEQAELLESWLFEENLSYKDALERAQKEFGIGGSLTGLRRFYGRLAKERGRESLTEAMSMCVEAAALGDNATLRAGLLTMQPICVRRSVHDGIAAGHKDDHGVVAGVDVGAGAGVEAGQIAE